MKGSGSTRTSSSNNPKGLNAEGGGNLYSNPHVLRIERKESDGSILRIETDLPSNEAATRINWTGKYGGFILGGSSKGLILNSVTPSQLSSFIKDYNKLYDIEERLSKASTAEEAHKWDEESNRILKKLYSQERLLK